MAALGTTNSTGTGHIGPITITERTTAAATLIAVSDADSLGPLVDWLQIERNIRVCQEDDQTGGDDCLRSTNEYQSERLPS